MVRPCPGWAAAGGQTGCSAAWLARHVRDVEVPGSNPGSPTTWGKPPSTGHDRTWFRFLDQVRVPVAPSLPAPETRERGPKAPLSHPWLLSRLGITMTCGDLSSRRNQI